MGKLDGRADSIFIKFTATDTDENQFELRVTEKGNLLLMHSGGANMVDEVRLKAVMDSSSAREDPVLKATGL
ncbi:MAG: hypothetical protein ACPL4E_04720 [Thermoproteota archaeon]